MSDDLANALVLTVGALVLEDTTAAMKAMDNYIAGDDFRLFQITVALARYIVNDLPGDGDVEVETDHMESVDSGAFLAAVGNNDIDGAIAVFTFDTAAQIVADMLTMATGIARERTS